MVVPSFALSSISFDFKMTGLQDSIKNINVSFVDSDESIVIILNVENGRVDTNLVLQNSGNYKIECGDTRIVPALIRVIPGWFSLIPPLLAIILALVIRQVLISLAAGIYVGAFFIFDYDPFTAFLRLIDTFVINTLVDRNHMIILVFTLLFGGVIGLISRNGGATGISNVIIKFAKKARSGLISTWLMGIIIFFDDYSNALIVGNMMRPITDRLRISREKLSYIVDSTSAPVTSLFLISSWIGFEVGLIDAGLRSVGSSENAYSVFLQTVPYRFYPIAAILFVFLTSMMKRDFGPMFKAEKRARMRGEVFEPGAVISDFEDESNLLYTGEKAKWYNGVIPIIIIVFGTVIGLAYTGIAALQANGITEYGFQEIIGNCDSFSALLWASFCACVVTIIMSVGQRILSLTEAMDAFLKGVKSMLFACIILTLAWSIGSITSDMKTADYLISILSEAISPRFLPVLIFLLCAAISFSTGTSYGTMAIVMPIIIPLSLSLSTASGYDEYNTILILHGVISSVLAGSVFGDHCSPISDTTILSSMASRCNHIDHVKTQLPYAVVVATFCMLIGDIPTAFGFSPYLSIIIIAAVLVGFLYLFGKKVPEAKVS